MSPSLGLALGIFHAVFAPSQRPQRPPIVAVLETRIGAIDGPSVIGRVEAVEVDSAGRVYVLESDHQRVRVFTRDGAAVDTLGRVGSGPGELRSPVGMAWAPDGNLWIIDPGNGRASIYATDGRHIADRRLTSGFELAPWPGRFDRSGHFYHYAVPTDQDGFGYVMIEYDHDLRPIDTITPPPWPEPRQVFENRTEQWGVVRARIPFTPRLVWRLGSDGRTWWAWTDRYEVFAGIDASTPVMARPRDGVAVTPAERAAALEGLGRFTQVGGRIDGSLIPRVKPPMHTFVLDEQDNLWVMPERSHGATGRDLEWYDSSGAHRANVRLPVQLRGSPPPIVRRSRIYGIERDDLDIPYVVVVRIGR